MKFPQLIPSSGTVAQPEGKLKGTWIEGEIGADPSGTTRAVPRNPWGIEQVVDERTDPYSARDYPNESRESRLLDLVKNEIGVESVIRQRSFSMVSDCCIGESGIESWERQYGEWQLEREQENHRV